METVTVTLNESGRRLDRFLKRYLRAAPLSLVYRLVRKDVKVNGERKGVDYILQEGDEIALYVDRARLDELARRGASRASGRRPKVQFGVCYEDDNVLVVSKPFGLLTHGDGREKKDTLVNQVVGYLLDRGEYDPSAERMFTPSPVNRLDRNTTGLVVFGKNAKAVRDFNRMIAAEDAVRKYYLALALGGIPEEVTFEGSILKDEGKNRVSVTEGPSAKESRTIARPVRTLHDGGSIYTLACVRLVTGRPHQIRAHLAEAGHPVVGDPKYGDRNANRRFAERHGLVSQFLHACRLEITEGRGSLEYLTGRVIESPLPRRLAGVLESLEQRD